MDVAADTQMTALTDVFNPTVDSVELQMRGTTEEEAVWKNCGCYVSTAVDHEPRLLEFLFPNHAKLKQ